MQIKRQNKPCKRKKCSYYNEIMKRCESCEWNPNSIWTENKKYVTHIE